MRIKNAIAAIAVAAAAAGGAAAVAVPAHAASAASGHATFCRDWGRFGDGPSYSNFIAVHQAAKHADSADRRLYNRFETALLAGYPTDVIRADSGAVWKDCGR
jgi:hypothetical protein